MMRVDDGMMASREMWSDALSSEDIFISSLSQEDILSEPLSQEDILSEPLSQEDILNNSITPLLASHAGCDHHLAANLLAFPAAAAWSPFLYAAQPAAQLRVSLRHRRDPYVAASALTAGCSSNTQLDAACLGRSAADTWGTAALLAILGGAMLLAVALVLLPDLSHAAPTLDPHTLRPPPHHLHHRHRHDLWPYPLSLI